MRVTLLCPSAAALLSTPPQIHHGYGSVLTISGVNLPGVNSQSCPLEKSTRLHCSIKKNIWRAKDAGRCEREFLTNKRSLHLYMCCFCVCIFVRDLLLQTQVFKSRGNATSPFSVVPVWLSSNCISKPTWLIEAHTQRRRRGVGRG